MCVCVLYMYPFLDMRIIELCLSLETPDIPCTPLYFVEATLAVFTGDPWGIQSYDVKLYSTPFLTIPTFYINPAAHKDKLGSSSLLGATLYNHSQHQHAGRGTARWTSSWHPPPPCSTWLAGFEKGRFGVDMLSEHWNPLHQV